MIEEQENPQAEPDAEAPAEAPEAEAPTTEDAASGADAPEAEAGDDAAPEAAAPAEPAEQLHPKERRRRARSAHSGETRSQRGPEDRAREREERRARNAKQRRAYRLKRREKRASQPRAAVGEQEAVHEAGRDTGRKRVREGVVVSSKSDKTITVRIDVSRRHRTYKKIVRESSTLHAHDERNEAGEGDTVRVIESRPLSRSKRWRLVEVVQRAR